MAEKSILKISDLTQKINRISSLVEVGSLLNSSLDIDEILNIIMKSSKRVMNASAATLFLYDEKGDSLVAELAYGNVAKKVKGKVNLKMGQGIAGWVAQHRKTIVINDVTKDKRFHCNVDKKTGFKTKSIVCAPLIYQNRLIGVAQALNKKEGNFSKEDAEIFSKFVSQAAVAIETARLHKEKLANQRLEQELTMALMIQDSFLPHINDISIKNLELGIKKSVAYNVSGDFYDLFMLDNTRYFFLFGDVSGKGIPAAMYMANLLSKIRYFVFRYKNLKIMIDKLNKELFRISKRGMFTTMICGILDTKSMKLHFINCGHLPLLMYNADESKWLTFYNKDNIPLGIDDSFEYIDEFINFYSEDIFVCISDGVIEAKDKDGTEFGIKRLLKTLPSTKSDPQSIVEKIFKRLKKYSGNTSFNDDVTIFSIKNISSPSFIELNTYSSPKELSSIRKFVKDFISKYKVSSKQSNRIVLAIDEAVTNIIKYSYEKDYSRPIKMKLKYKKGRIFIEIRDYGKPVVPENLRIKKIPSTKPGGLGLHFINQIMDTVSYEPRKKGTLLKMSRYIGEKTNETCY